MNRRKLSLLLLFVLLAALAWGYVRVRDTRNRYYKAVEETRKALEYVGQERSATDKALDDHLSAVELALQAAGYVSLGPVQPLITTIKQTRNVLKGTKAASQGDFNKAASETLKYSASLIKQSADELSTEGIGRGSAGLLGNAVRELGLVERLAKAAALLTYRAQLLQLEKRLQQNLFQANLRYDDDVEHNEFVDAFQSFRRGQELWEQLKGGTRATALERELKDAENEDPALPFRIASGKIVDDVETQIQELENIPCINPDFIAAVRKQFALIRRGDLASADASLGVNKYPDGRYIPAFNCSHREAESLEPQPPERDDLADVTLRWPGRRRVQVQARAGDWVLSGTLNFAMGEVLLLGPGESKIFRNIKAGPQTVEPGIHTFPRWLFNATPGQMTTYVFPIGSLEVRVTKGLVGWSLTDGAGKTWNGASTESDREAYVEDVPAGRYVFKADWIQPYRTYPDRTMNIAIATGQTTRIILP